MNSERVTCIRCDTPADKPLDTMYQHGFSCQSCGQQHILINVGGKPMRVEVTVTVTSRRKSRRRSHPAVSQSQAPVPQTPSSRAYRVKVSGLEDDPTGACVVDVSRDDGRPISTGVGAHQLETLQDAARYMLPTTHQDYPKS